MKLARLLLVFAGLMLFCVSVSPENSFDSHFSEQDSIPPPFMSADAAWVDSLMQDMTIDEMIAQMIMVQAYSNRNGEHLRELEKLIRKYKIGGLVFFQGGPVRQAKMINHLQAVSEVPLLVAMDAEWGLGMRLDSVISYPRQMMLGAIEDNMLIYQMGQDIAEQLLTLGVHMNFAPVADINNNPANPVINTRSFGEERQNVSTKVNAYFSGMQSAGVLVSAKHFPGHGDTNTDSHMALPVIDHERSRLDSIELYPFRSAIRGGVSGIMIAHLNVPELDARPNRPTTLSEATVTRLLKEEMGFQGLIVSDALNMKGVSDYFKPGELELEAVKAGIDILLMPSDIPKLISIVKKAVKRGELPVARIEESCRKVLLAKAWLGLKEQKPVIKENLIDSLNANKYIPLQHHLVRNALTLLKDPGGLLPYKDLSGLNMASLNIGIEGPNIFTETIDKYHSASHYYYSDISQLTADSSLSKILRSYDQLIVSAYYTRSYGNNYGIPPGLREYLNAIDFRGDLIINMFGYPYSLGAIGPLDNADAIILSYTDNELNQSYTAQAIFGAISFKGRLPVTIADLYPCGSGLFTEGGDRLRYSVPEVVGMNADTLGLIEEIIQNAIRNKAMPGCQLLVARKGEVILNKSYGYHTYRKRQAVENSDLYDLASITKIASTVPALMRLQEQKKFNVDSTLGVYMPFYDTCNKADILIKDILTHQAGLMAWIPFYTSTLEALDSSQSLFSTRYSNTYSLKMGPGSYANRNLVYKDSIYASEYSEEYPIQIAKGMYMRSERRDSIYDAIYKSPLGEKEYKYSDLGYYLLYRIIEDLSDTLFYPYSWHTFYGPIGAESLGFLPLNRFSEKQIVPTENDIIFRKQLLRGYVHDPGSAMLGGICGHAGLFSNANDLAKMMQMYLNGGSYGGIRFLDSTTIKQFTACQFCEIENRRGIGFDRPITEEDDAGPVCNSASALSFGHTGFTGTIAWMDPEYDLLYIFLSNRIHPDQFNINLIKMNVRTDIQEILYRSILKQ